MVVTLTRRSLLLTAPGCLEWVEEPLPLPGPREVLVQTVAGAVSVGTELPQYTGEERVILPRGYPRMTGYESFGLVLALGQQVPNVHIGDRVVAFYGHRTYATLPADRVIVVPRGIPDAIALLAILTCDVARGIRKLALLPDATVLVTGAGAIGLLTVWMLRASGVQRVDVSEPRPERRSLALWLGATHAFAPDAVGEAASAGNYAAGIECSASNAAFALLQQRIRRGGSICVLSDGNREPLNLSPDFHRNELRVVASSDGVEYAQHARWFYEASRQHVPNLLALFDAHVVAEDLPVLFEQMARGERTPVKVLVLYV